MTTNESRIYGTLLILASLMVIALVVMGAPAREQVKCEGYNLSFKIEEERDTFLIGERVTIVNETNDVRSLEWIVSDIDSVVVGKSMREQSLVLVFTREGEKNIQLKINDRKDCTTVTKPIFIMPNCSDGQQNGSEAGIDCGGNCPACDAVVAQNQPVMMAEKMAQKQASTAAGVVCDAAPITQATYRELTSFALREN